MLEPGAYLIDPEKLKQRIMKKVVTCKVCRAQLPVSQPELLFDHILLHASGREREELERARQSFHELKEDMSPEECVRALLEGVSASPDMLRDVIEDGGIVPIRGEN